MMNRNDLSPCRATGTALLAALFLVLPACSEGARSDPDEVSPQDEEDHDEHGDERPEGEPIQLTAAQVEAAGIRVERAAGGQIARYLRLPAVAAANADTMTHINPRAPGIVRSIHKHLGDDVAEGDLLCVIDSTQLGTTVAEFVRTRAMVEAGEVTLEREGELFQGRIESTKRMLDGAVEGNRQIYEREKELQEKAVSTMRPLLEAEKALKNSELERDRDLTDLRAERDAHLLALEVALTERRIDRDAARSALMALGVAPAPLEVLEPTSPLLAGTYEIRAPRGGIVSGRHITAGEFVDAQTKLYTLEDLSRVWILASAFEEQVRSVRTGQAGHIHFNAFPDQAFEARVMLIGYEVDPESRALGVRLELENPTLSEWPEEYPLRPGMFGSVDLEVESFQARIVLPETAIVHEDRGEFVFVRIGPGTFERRQVKLGPPSGDVVEVREGVELGEQIAVSGTFQLKSVQRRGELGEGHSH